MRASLERLVESRGFGSAIMAVILFNAALLGLETSQIVMARAGGVISALDHACLAVFVAEIIAKLIVQRGRYFTSGWNLFDFTIVAASLAPGGQGLSVLRALRILRLLRVVSINPSLRRVVEGFLSALPGMASVMFLMGLIFYIAAVMATRLFSQQFPQWFGTLGESAYSLFQIMTLESWSMGIVRPVMEAQPLAWLFFIPFILITTFAVMNLVVGLIVNSMQDAHSAEDTADTVHYRDAVLERLDAIEAQLRTAQDRRPPPDQG